MRHTHCVEQLPILEQVVDDVEGLHPGSPRGLGADCGEEALVIPNGKHFLDKAGKKETTAQAEEDVVDDEKGAQLHGRELVLAHDLTAAKYDDEVNSTGECYDGKGREGSPTRLP